MNSYRRRLNYKKLTFLPNLIKLKLGGYFHDFDCSQLSTNIKELLLPYHYDRKVTNLNLLNLTELRLSGECDLNELNNVDRLTIVLELLIL